MAEPIAANTYDAQAQPEPKAPEPAGPSFWERMLAYGDELDRAQKAKDEKDSQEE